MRPWFEWTEEELRSSWDVYHRWEWEINGKWSPDRIIDSYASQSVAALVPILKREGVHTVLDVSAGVGLKGLLLKRQGYSISLSDLSPVAVSRANELMAREGLEIEAEVAPWSHLEEVWGHERFDCVFCDALSWTPNEAIFRRSCASFYKTLRTMGILVWEGAPKGAAAGSDHQVALDVYQSRPSLEAQGPWELTCGRQLRRIISRQLAGAAIITQIIYVVTLRAEGELQVAHLAQPTGWSWDKVWSFLQGVGFASADTVAINIDGRERLYNVAWKS